MGASLAAQFPPLVKNVLGSNQNVATLFLAVFSVGVATGSVLINRLLGSRVLAVYAPPAAIAMGLFVVHLWWNVHAWPEPHGELMNVRAFLDVRAGKWVVFD